MKKIFSGLLFLCCVSIAIAQTKNTVVNVQMELRQIIKKLALQNDTAKGAFVNYISLAKVQSGTLKQIDSLIMPATATAFSFSFKPTYKGYYVVVLSRFYEKESPKYIEISKLNAQTFRFYAQGGETVNIYIDSMSVQKMEAGNTKENQLLSQWNSLLRPAQLAQFSNKDFMQIYPLFTSLDSSAKIWLKGKSPGNAAFDELFKKTAVYDIANAACRYICAPRRQDALWEKNINDYTGYVANTNFSSFMKDTFLLKLPNGIMTMNSMVNTAGRLNYLRGDSAKKTDYLEKALSLIPNPTLKAYFAADYSKMLNNYEKVQAIADKFGKYLTADQKKQMKDHIAALSEFKKGTQGYNFAYKDITGKKIAFDDLKGKVVLIDVWATWCGPCREQLPYLKALEEEFRDNDNVVFVGLSADEDVNLEKWKKFVADNDLKGVQLKADGGMRSQFSQIYKVSGIPRFMVFDKQGKVVTVDAPRPSEPALKELLIKTINGK